MSVFKVVSRYATALLELSQEQNALEDVKKDLDDFAKTLKSNSELRAVLANPIINIDRKVKILNALFEGKIHPLISKFFTLMVRKGRGSVIAATTEEFSRIYNQLKGIEHATITSAAALSEPILTEIKKILEEETGSTVLLKNTVQEDLIGGFVIKIGDRQLDASIAGKLNKLERHFETQGV